MKQFNKQALVVLALIVTANGCRTTDGFRWRGLSLGRQPEISADAQSIADSELPPPSAAVLPGKPLLGRAKQLTADATKSVTSSVKKATDKVRKTTNEVAEQTESYPATAYPQFQANNSETSGLISNAPDGLSVPSMPTPNIPNLRAPNIAVKQPVAQVALPEVPSAIRTASATTSTSAPLATTTTSGTNYATGPYSTSATAIPSQPLQQQTDTTATTAQQGYYNPQHTPTTSSRRSTLSSEDAPNYQIPEDSFQENAGPPPGQSSSTTTPGYYPTTATQPYPSTRAPAVSQASGTSPTGLPTTHAVEPATYNSAPTNASESFYNQPPQQPSNWRPGSTSQGSLASPQASSGSYDASGCSNGVCTIPQGATASGTPHPPATYQQPVNQQPIPQPYMPQQTSAPAYSADPAPTYSPPGTAYQTAAQPQVMTGDNRESTWR